MLYDIQNYVNPIQPLKIPKFQRFWFSHRGAIVSQRYIFPQRESCQCIIAETSVFGKIWSRYFRNYTRHCSTFDFWNLIFLEKEKTNVLMLTKDKRSHLCAKSKRFTVNPSMLYGTRYFPSKSMIPCRKIPVQVVSESADTQQATSSAQESRVTWNHTPEHALWWLVTFSSTAAAAMMRALLVRHRLCSTYCCTWYVIPVLLVHQIWKVRKYVLLLSTRTRNESEKDSPSTPPTPAQRRLIWEKKQPH